MSTTATPDTGMTPEPRRPLRKRTWFRIAVPVLALGIIGAIVSGSATNHPNAVAPKPAPSTSAPASHPAAGPRTQTRSSIPDPAASANVTSR
jgi:hypothetical protein